LVLVVFLVWVRCFCSYSAPVGQFGTDTFTYVLRDSFGATGVSGSVGVVPAVGNEAPVGRADRGGSGRSLSVDVLSNDADPW
jgi:hypothetical protein